MTGTAIEDENITDGEDTLDNCGSIPPNGGGDLEP